MIGDLVRRGLFGLGRIVGGGGRGLILLYHRIADEPADPYGLCVSPAHFEEHLALLRRRGRPMPVADMARAVRDGSLPDRAIGITFDDAYVDVLERAVPLLMEHDVPATVFVTVGAGGREREFWWDELERVFLGSPRLPGVLRLELGATDRTWSLGADAVLDPERRAPEAPWHLLDENPPTKRHAVFREIYERLRPMPEEARTSVMDRLLEWAGETADALRSTRRVMSPDEVAGMTGTGLVRVGAHTVSHPDLPSLPAALRREEVRRSKSVLEDWTGGEVDGFAYPYGLYDEGSVSAVREAGFVYACTGDHAAVRPGSDPLVLPRVDVPAGGGEGLSALVRRFLG